MSRERLEENLKGRKNSNGTFATRNARRCFIADGLLFETSFGVNEKFNGNFN